MPIPQKYLADFNEGCIYHVYNRTNNREKLFLSDENRYFFLKRYDELLTPFIDTFCWSLLPNHFHLLVSIKSSVEIVKNLGMKDLKDLTGTERKFMNGEISAGVLIEQSFKRFFQSYSLAFNKMYDRKGNLFYKPFKRMLVEKEKHFTQAIIYIHANAMKHQLVPDFTKYQWSSWKSLLSESPTRLLRNEVIKWFGNIELFVKTHIAMTKYYYESDVSIED